MGYIQELGARAKQAAAATAALSSGEKNAALHAIADALLESTGSILSENQKDIAAAQENGMRAAMVDRLRLTEERIAGIADACRYTAGLGDPVGEVLGGSTLENGLRLTKIAVPLGVVGIIFESRPNVTVDCAALCLKSGNACILRGGKEAIHSNTALVRVMQKALQNVGINPDAVLLVEDTSRDVASEMMRLNECIDVLIPRGGPGLISAVVKNATVPVIETGVGNCHVYVDAGADLGMALAIVDNAKTQRPSVCNAIEAVLVHEEIAEAFLTALPGAFTKPVELRACPKALAILGDKAVPAADEDWLCEYGDYILAVKVVGGVDEAIAHINRCGTHHSDCIVTRDYANSQKFTRLVDSAAVYTNASTRFTDGGEFGLGAEIGISTQKLHARGPMGLRELTSYKYIIDGSGQVR